MELKRSTSNGQAITQTYWDSEGNEYEVPLYQIPYNHTANDVAAALGGRIPKFSEQRAAIESKLVYAAVSLEGRACPVIK